jgi:cell division GTPase FtsZ
MDEKKQVVIDETGEKVREKTKEEIEIENKLLEKTLAGEEKKPQLDPDILKKLAQKAKGEKKVEIQSVRDRSIYFGVVGLGQAGSRVAEVFYNLGYETCIFNTAQQDMEFINLPEDKKVFLPFGLGGAGKQLSNGAKAIEQNADLVLEKLQNVFSDEQEMIFLAISGGGGSGSGGAEGMISLLSTLGKPIGVIYILPLESEDSLSKHNAVSTLSTLSKMTSSDVITTLVVVDNAKIELIYPNLSKADFWDVSNAAIVEPLHLFNHLSSLPTKYDALDPMDFGRLITVGDCLIYGMLEVEDYMETTAIAEAVIENLESGLLASDFNLEETRFCGFIITGSEEVLKNLPAANINYASHVLSEKCNSPQLVSGVYATDEKEDIVKVYTILNGLGLPAKRIDSLKKEAESKMSIAMDKEKTRSNRMTVDYGSGTDTQNKAQQVHKMIQEKKSGFGKLTQNAGQRIVDRRKR